MTCEKHKASDIKGHDVMPIRTHLTTWPFSWHDYVIAELDDVTWSLLIIVNDLVLFRLAPNSGTLSYLHWDQTRVGNVCTTVITWALTDKWWYLRVRACKQRALKCLGGSVNRSPSDCWLTTKRHVKLTKRKKKYCAKLFMGPNVWLICSLSV